MISTVLLIDGGGLRVFAKRIGQSYTGDFVEDFAQACGDEEERVLRVLFYDAPLFEGKVIAPVSGEEQIYRGGSAFLDDIARRERFAVRRGTLVFRGWKPKRYQVEPGEQFTDADYDPIFEQKGVDMRLGLDIASYTERRGVDRLVLVTTDSDLVAAMKHARRGGLEVGIVQLPPPMRPLSAPLLEHSDFVRHVEWSDDGPGR